jgi:hypothetical protein
MNFNDLDSRINRIYSSINLKYDYDVVKNTNFITYNTDEIKGYFINFGNDSESEKHSKIISILYNISTLKDHLKGALSSKQLDENIVEETINNNLCLQLLIDLVNQDKHGYPLTKYIRSGKNPILKNFSQTLQLITDGKNKTASMSFTKTGEMRIQGKNRISITCDVFDENGLKLCNIDELVDNCMTVFEEIIQSNGLTS